MYCGRSRSASRYACLTSTSGHEYLEHGEGEEHGGGHAHEDDAADHLDALGRQPEHERGEKAMKERQLAAAQRPHRPLSTGPEQGVHHERGEHGHRHAHEDDTADHL